MQDIRIAIVICQAQVGQIQDNLDKVESFTKTAGKEGAGIICFPEMNITGYTNHHAATHIAQPVPGPVSEKLLETAAANNMLILAGMAEKAEDGNIYASHLIVKPEGDIELYRKLHIAPPEREHYTPGDDIPIHRFRGIRFGVQLCFDAHFPELSTQMALKGAEILFMPHASPRGTAIEKHNSWMRHLTARAYDNSVFVVACNQTGPNGKGLVFPGNAVVISPTGRVIAKSLSSRENIMFTDLSVDELDKVRNNPMHFFLPNRRPGIY
jgi:N-carbamoylputrescine amidase